MMQKYGDIRNKLEKEGYKLPDDEFRNLLQYARRKAERAWKDESYLPLLLPDVIKDYFFGTTVNAISISMMEGSNI